MSDTPDSTPAHTLPPADSASGTPSTDNGPLTTETPTTPPHLLARNRQNAQKSTGPKSPEGKAASARNARTHGLRARLTPDTLVPQPDREDYAHFLQDLRDHLDPTSPLEHLLVERIALLAYKLRRHAQAEADFLDQANRKAAEKYEKELEHHRRYRTRETPAPPQLETPAQLLTRFASTGAGETLETLHRYETATERAFYKALHQYHALRTSTNAPTPDQHHHFHYHRHADTQSTIRNRQSSTPSPPSKLRQISKQTQIPPPIATSPPLRPPLHPPISPRLSLDSAPECP